MPTTDCLIINSYHILSLVLDHVEDLNRILQAYYIIFIRINEVFMLIIIENTQHFLTTKGQTASKLNQSLQTLLLPYHLRQPKVQKDSSIVMLAKSYVWRLDIEVYEMDAMKHW